MIKDRITFNNRLKRIEKDILSLKSDVASEQIINNEELEKIVYELSEYENIVFEVLKNSYEQVVPEKESKEVVDLFKQSEEYRSIIKMVGKDSLFVERFGFDRTIYEIGNGKSVDRVNEVLKEFINDMDTIGIQLTYKDFDYSVYTLKYMEMFFNNMKNRNYLFIMRQCFDNLYWDSPLLLTHLELCVRDLVNKSKKTIVSHIDKLINYSLKKNNITINELHEKYVTTKKHFDEVRMADFYNIFEYFKEHPNEIDKYILGSQEFNGAVGKLFDVKAFNTMGTQDKKFISDNIKNLYFDLIEYRVSNKFKDVFNYVKGILETSSDDGSIYKSTLSTIKKLDREKEKYNKKLIYLYNKRERIDSNSKDKINKINEEIKVLNSKLTKVIEDIKENTDILSNKRFIIDLKREINSSSTIYKVAYFLSKYYRELNNIFISLGYTDDTSNLVDEFRHIQYIPHLNIIDTISFYDIDNIKELILKKYSMFDINVLIPDDYRELDKVFNELLFFIRFDNIEHLSHDALDIKVLVEMSEIIEKNKKDLEEVF